jgi:hypothetical protein
LLNGHAKGTRATIKGTTFTSPGGGVCHTVGTYKIKLSGTKLTFSVIKDSDRSSCTD